MTLQLALDGTLDEALRTLDVVHALVERIEIGTPLVYREGMRAVRHIRSRYGGLQLVVDLKIMDAGDEEASIAFDAGADEVSVLALASDATVAGVVAAARRAGGSVVADLIEAPRPVERAHRLLAAGVDLLAVHVGVDAQRERAPFEALVTLRAALPAACLAVAGGIGPTNAARLADRAADVVIVGGGITRSADPRAAALAIRAALGMP